MGKCGSKCSKKKHAANVIEFTGGAGRLGAGRRQAGSMSQMGAMQGNGAGGNGGPGPGGFPGGGMGMGMDMPRPKGVPGVKSPYGLPPDPREEWQIEKARMDKVPLTPSGMPWERDEDVAECRNCLTKFGMVTRRHHCRECGKIFCAKCCDKFKRLPLTAPPNLQENCRVCLHCVEPPSTVKHDPTKGIARKLREQEKLPEIGQVVKNLTTVKGLTKGLTGLVLAPVQLAGGAVQSVLDRAPVPGVNIIPGFLGGHSRMVPKGLMPD
eukprot:gnl/Spiro4/17804_TR9462_c0_g1_i1.p1 gnl/Spiro4/17804_TR9462_c0_g1~~gnl/Spiro4/17804_TR9462_c0_g1_i1.p1  ORF type:complete len:267 (+),score=21.98 gnl/Spiro4/17804_TR9462_c0_g1_i1:181-981(+)